VFHGPIQIQSNSQIGLRATNWLLSQSDFTKFNFGPRTLPWTPLVELTTSPRSPSRLGMEIPPPNSPSMPSASCCVRQGFTSVFDLQGEGGALGEFNPHWLRMTHTLITENSGLEVGFDPPPSPTPATPI